MSIIFPAGTLKNMLISWLSAAFVGASNDNKNSVLVKYNCAINESRLQKDIKNLADRCKGLN